MNFFYDRFPTPLGEFAVIVDETGAVAATAFGEPTFFRARLAGRQLMVDKDKTAAAREQLQSYFAGRLRTFDLPLAAEGSGFQKQVWAALLEIPYGETRSYGTIAKKLGSSARAVGRANATNPICIIVPCHRVIGSDGSLTGFAFGEEIKRRLLELEDAPAFRELAALGKT